MLFATEEAGSANVNTWLLDLATGEASILLSNLTVLLAPCAPTCNQASTFHASWTPDGAHVIFAFRAWDRYGNAIGSQAIAVADADGTNIKALTYTQDGPDGGAFVSVRNGPQACKPSALRRPWRPSVSALSPIFTYLGTG